MPEDHATFATGVFERHGSALHRYFRRLTGSGPSADDLSQEVFLRVLRGAEDYQPIERERAWVFRIARRVFLDDRRRDRAEHLATRQAERAAPASQPVALALREALDRLQADEREAFLLGEVGGLAYTEIAAATGASLPAVRNRIYRARLALRQALSPPAPAATGVIERFDDDE